MTETQSVDTLPPHFRCDCVPDLGPAHCHRCSRIGDTPVDWSNAPCKSWVESPAYSALLAAGADDALLLVSLSFDEQLSPGEDQAEPGAGLVFAPQLVPAAAAPVAVPAPPKVALHVAAREPRPLVEKVKPYRFTDLARSQVSALGFTPRDIVAILERAHVQTQSTTGTAMNHYGDDLLIMVDVDGECIISVIQSRKDVSRLSVSAAAYSTESHAKPKSYSGGPGRRMPSTLKELLSMLNEHGFVTQFGGSGHHIAEHPTRPGTRISVPSTPSDHRSFPNLIAEIKRRVGIDITKKEV